MGPGQSKWISYHSKQNSQNKETHFLLNPCSITDSCPAAWPLSILTSPYTIRTTASNYSNMFQHVCFTDLMEGDTHLSSRGPSSPESKASFPLPTLKATRCFQDTSWTLLCFLGLQHRSVTHTSVHTFPLSWVSQTPTSAGPTHPPHILQLSASAKPGTKLGTENQTPSPKS